MGESICSAGAAAAGLRDQPGQSERTQAHPTAVQEFAA